MLLVCAVHKLHQDLERNEATCGEHIEKKKNLSLKNQCKLPQLILKSTQVKVELK